MQTIKNTLNNKHQANRQKGLIAHLRAFLNCPLGCPSLTLVLIACEKQDSQRLTVDIFQFERFYLFLERGVLTEHRTDDEIVNHPNQFCC